MPTHEQLEQRYRDWWQQSYPFVKPAAHAVTAAAAFALLVLQEQQEGKADD